MIDNLVKEVLSRLNLIRENEDNPIEIIKIGLYKFEYKCRNWEKEMGSKVNILSKLKFDVSKCE